MLVRWALSAFEHILHTAHLHTKDMNDNLLHMQLFYPKQTDKPLYKGLVTQLKSLNIPMPSIDDIKAKPLRDQFDVVVDSIFGFGFTGAPRPPFDTIIEVSPAVNPGACASRCTQQSEHETAVTLCYLATWSLGISIQVDGCRLCSFAL